MTTGNPAIETTKSTSTVTWQSVTRFFKAVSSVNTAIALLTVLLVLSILGTFFPERDIFHSPPWQVCLVMLAVSLVVVSLQKRRLRVQNLGFLLSHLGVVVILIGGAFYSFYGAKGMVYIPQGEETRVLMEKSGARKILPFSIALRDFRVEHYPPRLLTWLPASRKDSVIKVERKPKGKIEGTPYRYQVLDVLPHGRIEASVSNQSEEPNHPAVRLEVKVFGGKAAGWLFAKGANEFSGGPISVTYEWYQNQKDADRALDQPSPLRFKPASYQSEGPLAHSYFVRLIDGENIMRKLLVYKDGNLVHSGGLKILERYQIDEGVLEIFVQQYYSDARLREIAVADRGGDPAIRVRIEGPEGREEKWLSASDTQPVSFQQGGLVMAYRTLAQEIRSYESDVEVLDGKKVRASKTIRVNDPMAYQGYRIYQASYDERNLAWSGLLVVKDPGLSVVYIGFGLILVGIIFMFYVKPFLMGRPL